MIKKTILAVGIVVLLLFVTYFVGTGLMRRSDVALIDYTVSEDGSAMTIHVSVVGSMGYIRGCSAKLGHEDTGLYVTFYSAFGGPNSSLGARDTFTFELPEECERIHFWREGKQYTCVLRKKHGVWVMVQE